MTTGICKLCCQDKVLLKSHLMPAALYGNRKKEFEISTPYATMITKTQVKQPLLCQECEQRFDQNGETHVLEVIAPKNTEAFSLHERMRVAYARDSDASSSRFFGPDFGLDMAKFAYFAVSVIWRITVCQWPLPDGSLTTQLNLGDFHENMRKYLLGEITLPSDIAVIVIVCSDVESRQRFLHPAMFVAHGCMNFGFLARGVYFRVMMGYQMMPFLRAQSCTNPLKIVWYGDCKKRTLESLPRSQ